MYAFIVSAQENNKNIGSTIYFYRPWMYYGALVKLDIYDNDKLIGNISNNGEFAYCVPNGGMIHLKSKGKGSLYKKSTEIEIYIEPGKCYFVKVCWDTSSPLSTRTAMAQVPYSEAREHFPQLAQNNSLDNTRNQVSSSIKSGQEDVSSSSINPTVETRSDVIISNDVDLNIPVSMKKNDHAYALIIGNEDYSAYQTGLSSELNVEYAINDARIFRKYCTDMLGIPITNIQFLTNATSAPMKQAISKISKIIQLENGKAEVVFYYSGHGLPDEQTHESYIIPVDVSGNDTISAIKLKDLYSKFAQYPSKKVTVFLDACFSGGGRNKGLVAARGVKVKQKTDVLSGNLVVFTSSSGEQSSLGYKEKQHGMFTYFLLKKLQETNGNITYSDLYDYLKREVDLNCVKINSKSQTPSLLIPDGLGEQWMGWKLK